MEEIKDKNKPKNETDSPSRRAGVFALLWAMSYFAAIVIIAFAYVEWREYPLGRAVGFPLAFALALAFIGVTQMWLLRRVLPGPMRGWLTASLVGAILSGILFYPSLVSHGDPDSPLVLFAPLALPQAVWLWRRVRFAVLWPLVHVASAALSVWMDQQDVGYVQDPMTEIFLLLFAVPLVYGLVMWYLCLRPLPYDPLKAKRDDEKVKWET